MTDIAVGENAYATTDDLTAYLGYDAPPGSERALCEAKDLFDATPQISWTRSRYTVYVSGPLPLPNDEQVAEALRKASCAQVEMWIVVNTELPGDFNVRRPTEGGVLYGEQMPDFPPVIAPKAEDIFRAAGVWRTGLATY